MLDDFIEERFDAGILIEERIDVALGFALLDLEVASEGELGLAVDDREVHGFGPVTHALGDLLGPDIEECTGGLNVDVVSAGEGIDQSRVPAEVRKHPELDLGVIGGEHRPALLWHEGVAHPPAHLGPDRDVLEVRVARREASGGGDELVVAGMDASGVRIHLPR